MNKIKNPGEKLLFFFGVILYCVIMYALESYCFVRTVFGIPCPGCGMTRAVMSMLCFDFSKALMYHPLLPLTPLMLLYFLFDGRLFGKRIDKIVLVFIAAAFALVWVLRLAGVIYSP